MELISFSNANSYIRQSLERNVPFFATRPGGTENQILAYVDDNLLTYSSESELYRAAKFHAGVITNGSFEELKNFADCYKSALKNSSLIGVWYPANTPALFEYSKKLALYLYSSGILSCHLEHLLPWESYFNSEIPWTSALHGKRVMVIHPFASSIQANYGKRNAIHIIKDILPNFELITLVPPITNAETSSQYPFSHHLDLLINKCDEMAKYFDVAIIGAGAYGAIIGNHIFGKLGKSAIHLGGSTQLLFGIGGARWLEQNLDTKKYYSKIIDSSWTRPLDSERPDGFNNLELGCYW